MDYFQHLLMRSIIWVAVIMLAVLENGCNGCLEKERIALLQLKHSINFPNSISLPSWKEDDSMDCCHWERVECNFTTRRVIKLELYGARDYWRDDYWHLNASILLPFESLRTLNLSRNLLRSFVRNEGIEILPNFSNLEELDLSYNYLDNSILPSLNKLSNLKLLRLAWNRLNDSLYVEGIGILSNLTNLEELDLSGNYLGNGILPSLNNFSNLKNLNLANTNLNGSIYVKGIGILSNLTNVEELDLSQNNLGNGILPSLNNFSNLKNLNLAGTNLNGSINVKGSQEESGILKKLEVLDLSDNDFDNSVWSFLRGLSSIKTLDLSYNRGLHGAVHNKDLRNLSNIETLHTDGVMLDDVLPYIRVMTSLQVLSLKYCESKRIPSIEGLCELKKLRELDITGTGFGDTLPWCLENLTSLRLLDITDNHFTGNIAQSPLINLTSLEYLAISNNNFEVPISFKSFFNHSKLVFIESLNNMLLEEEDFPATSPSFQLIGLCLSNSKYGHISRSFPHFLYHQHDLILVELSRTDFIGNFPYWLLDNNTRMETLILSYNAFGGPLVLPARHMRNLLVLDVSNNHLEGFLPYQISSSFLSLEFFNMSTNNFEGNIPSSFGDMTALQVLDLSNNRLSGKIPVHLAEGCPSLSFLSLSNNNFTGLVLPHQNNLTELGVLYSANNAFTEIPPNLSRSNLIHLDVSANQLVGKIPAGFLGNFLSLKLLTMAGNHLEGPIPTEICQLKNLQLLDLSENDITGAVPSCFNSSQYVNNIRLSKNRLDGPFPMAFKNYSTSLKELDLSYNQFSGTIPAWIGSLSELTVLRLQNNNFEGNIPKELCNLSSLTIIDLSFNNHFGIIPPCISEIKFDGIHSIHGYIYYHDDSAQTFTLLLHDLRMVLANREKDRGDENFVKWATGQEAKFTTKGMSLTYKEKILRFFSGINLSHNRLTGPIPPEIGNLSHLKSLNFSHNNFTGTIPVTFSNLKSIESLDLSYNDLNGKIPSQLTELYSLAVFNLSYNNLSGRMPPRVKQFGTFEWSSYVGNPLLCGEPLPKCNGTDSPPSMPRATDDTEEDSGFLDMDVFYMSFAGSYITVVLAIVAILFINPYWRRAWFQFVEVCITACYYFVVDNLVGRRRGFLWK